MQSVLETELRRLLLRLRDWLERRDRAVLFGALLCCVPFLPVTFLGVLITLGNLVLLRLGKLPRDELPLLGFALLMALVYVVLWWLLFQFVLGSLIWLAPLRVWNFIVEWWPLRPPGVSIHA